MTRHTLSVLVQHKPGVLARITGLFLRRGFDLEAVTDVTVGGRDVSRVTVVVNAEHAALEQIVKQVGKLVNVLEVVELTPTQQSGMDAPVPG